MKWSVVVLAGIFALIVAQAPVMAQGLSGAPGGDVIATGALGLDIENGAFEPGVNSTPEELDTLQGEVGDAPDVVEQ